MRILSVVGARPQSIKLKPVRDELTARHLEHFVIHTSQHYDVLMSEGFFQGLGIPAPEL